MIISREEWGAKHGTGTIDPGPETNVVIHNSYQPALNGTETLAQEAAAWRGIEEYHVRKNGWDGIGYNFGVTPSGRILEGRGWKYRGAHAGPINGDSIGICLLIDGQKTDPMTFPRMMAAVRGLITLGIGNGEIKPEYKISGHRDWMARTCPGDLVYSRLQLFRHDIEPLTRISTGTRRWSDYYKEHVVVTRYVSNSEWYFVLESQLKAAPAQRASALFSSMPPAKQ